MDEKRIESVNINAGPCDDTGDCCSSPAIGHRPPWLYQSHRSVRHRGHHAAGRTNPRNGRAIFQTGIGLRHSR